MQRSRFGGRSGEVRRNGFEGFRCLMESQLEEWKGHSLHVSQTADKNSVGNEQSLLRNQPIERLEGSDQESLDTTSKEKETHIKVGKMSILSSQIREAARALTLQVVQNEVKTGDKEDQSKSCGCSTRRKGGIRDFVI